MGDAKDVFSVFRPLHSEAFIEPPYHEWVQGERQRTKREAEAKARHEEVLRKLQIQKDKEKAMKKLKEEERKQQQETELLAEKTDPQRIPTMKIDTSMPRLNEAKIPDPDIFLVEVSQFKAAGKIPKFPERTVKLSEIDINNSLLVFLSHAWIELPGKKLDRRIIRKVKVVEEKPDIGDFYFDGVVDESSESEEEEIPSRPPTPDGCSKGITILDTLTLNKDEGGAKWKLYCEALDHMLPEFAPDMEKVYIWMDYCCVPQPEPDDPKDPDVTIGQQLNLSVMNKWGLLTFDRIMTYMDCMLTCVVDDDYIHNPWTLKSSGKGLHRDYAAKAWQRYLGRRWCRLEMSYSTCVPFPHEEEYQYHAVFDRKMNPLLGKGVMRAERLAGGVQYERYQARRAHLIYGTRESHLKLPPKLLPALPIEVLNAEYNPMEGDYSRAGDAPILDRLNRELWPFTRKGEAGYVGERDNWAAVGQVGRKHGQGKMSYPNGNEYEGQWFENHMQGNGVYRHNNGDGVEMDVYVGKMKYGLQHGESAGTYSRWDGASYRGDWNMGIREGIGTFTWPDGSLYRGYWKEDERHGWGDLTLSSGAKFSGMWLRGKRDGKGSMKWPDGSYYEGEWKKDKRHGFGTYWTPYARGHLYVGEWVNGVKEGRGTLTLGGGVHEHSNDYQTTTEWLSGQGLDSQVLDGFFQGGNFIREADHAGEEERLNSEAAGAFEIDSDEERALEAAAHEETEKRLKREREMSQGKNRADPSILAAAAEKLAAAAARRRAIRNGENVDPLPLDDMSELSDENTDEQLETGRDVSTERSAGNSSFASKVSTIAIERRPSRSTPRPYVSPYTPRPPMSPEVAKAWMDIDKLEEGNLNDRMLLLELSKKYSKLSELYGLKGNTNDREEMKNISESYKKMASELKSQTANGPSIQAVPKSRGNEGMFDLSDNDEGQSDGQLELSDLPPKAFDLSTLNTPRDQIPPDVKEQWSIIDEIESRDMSSREDYFYLSRHYSRLSDLYRQHKSYHDALEIKKRSIECISGFSNFPKFASKNERRYLLTLNDDIQAIRECLYEQEIKDDGAALRARREIAKILYPDEAKKLGLVENKFDSKGGNRERILPPDMHPIRDVNGYKVYYEHDP